MVYILFAIYIIYIIINILLNIYPGETPVDMLKLSEIQENIIRDTHRNLALSNARASIINLLKLLGCSYTQEEQKCKNLVNL
jgi:hypothetical protein